MMGSSNAQSLNPARGNSHDQSKGLVFRKPRVHRSLNPSMFIATNLPSWKSRWNVHLVQNIVVSFSDGAEVVHTRFSFCKYRFIPLRLDV